jgi:hypothetical protein
MANALADVQNTFTSLDQNYNMLRAACQTDDDRKALDAKYEAAESNYDQCVDKMLADTDPQVATLLANLKPLNDQVAKAVTEMGNMSKVIDTVTQAVTLGSQLLKLV